MDAQLGLVLALRGVELGEAVWWRVGGAKLRDGLTINWGGVEGLRIAGKQVVVLFWCLFLFCVVVFCLFVCLFLLSKLCSWKLPAAHTQNQKKSSPHQKPQKTTTKNPKNKGVGVIAACQAVLMGGPEYARFVGIKSLEPVGVFLPGAACWVCVCVGGVACVDVHARVLHARARRVLFALLIRRRSCLANQSNSKQPHFKKGGRASALLGALQSIGRCPAARRLTKQAQRS